jgi:hypothetical protein
MNFVWRCKRPHSKSAVHIILQSAVQEKHQNIFKKDVVLKIFESWSDYITYILNVRAARKKSVMLPIYIQQIEQIFFFDIVVLNQP